PRVAADGNPGLHDATPSGLETLFRFTQGSRGRQPRGCTTQPLQGWKPCFDLPRVAADGNPGLHDATPSGLETLFRFTQGSRGRQPWAARRNPFRVGNLVSIFP